MLSGAGADNESMHEAALGEAPQTLPRTRPASAPVKREAARRRKQEEKEAYDAMIAERRAAMKK